MRKIRRLVLAVMMISLFVLCSCGETEVKSGIFSDSGKDDKITLFDVRDWVTDGVWNNICDLNAYIDRGTDCCGREYDADFGYKQYLKALEKRDEYTEYIHKEHPDIAETWDKMFEQVDLINENLADGFETGSEKLKTDLFKQYESAFDDYYDEVEYGE